MKGFIKQTIPPELKEDWKRIFNKNTRTEKNWQGSRVWQLNRKEANYHNGTTKTIKHRNVRTGEMIISPLRRNHKLRRRRKNFVDSGNTK